MWAPTRFLFPAALVRRHAFTILTADSRLPRLPISRSDIKAKPWLVGIGNQQPFRCQLREELHGVIMRGLRRNGKLPANGIHHAIHAPSLPGGTPNYRAYPVCRENRSAVQIN